MSFILCFKSTRSISMSLDNLVTSASSFAAVSLHALYFSWCFWFSTFKSRMLSDRSRMSSSCSWICWASIPMSSSICSFCRDILSLRVTMFPSIASILPLRAKLCSLTKPFIFVKMPMSKRSSITSLRDPDGNCMNGTKLLEPKTTTWWNDLWLSFKMFSSKTFW